MTKASEPISACDSNLAYGGLTKREYFAAMAMQGLNALPNYNNLDDTLSWHQSVAKDAVQVADALIAELNK